MHIRSLRIQMPGSRSMVTSCLTAAGPEEHPAPSPVGRRYRHRSRDRACAVPAAHAPAIRRACGRAIPAAAAVRRAPVSVAGSRAADCPAALPAAARSAVPALQAGFLAVRSASRSRPCDARYRARYYRWPCHRSIAVGAITAPIGRCSPRRWVTGTSARRISPPRSSRSVYDLRPGPCGRSRHWACPTDAKSTSTAGRPAQ
jgi:hypothetical protein